LYLDGWQDPLFAVQFAGDSAEVRQRWNARAHSTLHLAFELSE
jgi:hypothetical protein